MTHIALRRLLEPAYAPCPGFAGPCGKLMRWEPGVGHIPRGFLGADGTLKEVELVLVFAEPGDPHPDEKHVPHIESPLRYARRCFETEKDRFHQNVRYLLNQCFPRLTFREQLRKVWLTDSVLCSAPKECGHLPMAVARHCAGTYLVPQLQLLKPVVVGALGRKAQNRLRAAGVTDFISAHAVAPPGAYRKQAKPSWDALAARFRQARR